VRGVIGAGCYWCGVLLVRGVIGAGCYWCVGSVGFVQGGVLFSSPSGMDSVSVWRPAGVGGRFPVVLLVAIVCCACAGRLPQPAVISSVDGVLDTTISVEVSRSTAGPFAFNRRSYNGQPTGPTLRVKKGDTLRLVLNNTLGDEAPTKIGQYYTSQMAKNKTGDWMHDRDVYSYPNFTNIHLHGLHVSPLGDSDNIFRTCAPLHSLVYHYKIPLDHPSGTFWYHPHFQGSSSLQLASGMMGAIIVEDEHDEISESLRSMEEVVLVLHEVSHSNRQHTENIICYFCMDNFMWPSGDRLPLDKILNKERFPSFARCGGKYWNGTKGDFVQLTQPFDCTFVLFNGAYQPEIPLTANVYQRWRLVQSSHQSSVRFSIPSACTVKILAMDGIYLTTPRVVTGLPFVVTAGSRADLAIKCPVGEFNVTSLPGGVHDSNMIHGAKTLYQPVLYPQLLAKIVVADGAWAKTKGSVEVPHTLPTNKKDDLRKERVDRYYRVVYNLTAYGVEGKIPKFIGQFLNGGQFSINGKSYTNRTEHCMVENYVEEWTVVNAANTLDRWMHSFHIHQNSFQIINQTLGERGQLVVENLVNGDWRDTVQIPVGGSVTFRMKPIDFVGPFPFHCHVTAHQGIGMMEIVEVFPHETGCPNVTAA
jgi:FtsP/CotA-like multicopper oxidase with cupredoxin domain